MPNKEEFRKELKSQLQRAELRGELAVEIDSRELHRRLGGYPGKDHRMRTCCDVMYEEKKADDLLMMAPEKGKGAIIIRYGLPR